jgi:hypothetical protein
MLPNRSANCNVETQEISKSKPIWLLQKLINPQSQSKDMEMVEMLDKVFKSVGF